MRKGNVCVFPPSPVVHSCCCRSCSSCCSTPCTLPPTDCLLACLSGDIAVGWCAGVWEFITSKEAIELVGDCETPEEACRVVSDQAMVLVLGGRVGSQQGMRTPLLCVSGLWEWGLLQ